MGKKLTEMTLKELWELFPIYLERPNDEWKKYYLQEEELLKPLLPKDCEIYHIGSTAIDGIWAKPIVDILVCVPTDESLNRISDGLQKYAGYMQMSVGKERISLNKGYTEKGFSTKVFHLHLQYIGNLDEVLFRDYLNANKDVAKEYEALKLQLCKEFEHDRDGYTFAKTQFVIKYTKIAKDCFRNL